MSITINSGAATGVLLIRKGRAVFPMYEQPTMCLRTLCRLGQGRRVKLLLLGICMIAVRGATLASEAAEQSPYIAGVAPDHRRTDVPTIMEAPPFDEKHAFRGIEQPYPASLSVFKDQGAWYTPFTLPGMTGNYDIRGYHRQ